MTVESNYAIATLSDSLKNLAPVLQSMRSKTNRTLDVGFFPRFEQVTARENETERESPSVALGICQL